MSSLVLGPFDIDRVFRAVEQQRQRLRRATRALGDAGIPYAVVGGSAVASWVSRVDPSAVRFTQDVDVLLRREDLEAAKFALQSVGFRYRHAAGITMFLDGPDGTFRDAVHIIFAREKVRDAYLATAPDVEESEPTTEYRVVTLAALVNMKLTSFRDKDRTHLRDMIDVGLIDQTWVASLPQEFADRLQELFDTPEG